jgi:hypothetical protein
LVPALGFSKWNAQLQKLGKCLGEILEEGIFVLGIQFDILFEIRVHNESNITEKESE